MNVWKQIWAFHLKGIQSSLLPLLSRLLLAPITVKKVHPLTYEDTLNADQDPTFIPRRLLSKATWCPIRTHLFSWTFITISIREGLGQHTHELYISFEVGRTGFLCGCSPSFTFTHATLHNQHPPLCPVGAGVCRANASNTSAGIAPSRENKDGRRGGGYSLGCPISGVPCFTSTFQYKSCVGSDKAARSSSAGTSQAPQHHRNWDHLGSNIPQKAALILLLFAENDCII